MNYLWAFVVGGAICVVGQLLIDYTKLSPARILTGYVVAGVILSAVGLYDPLVKLAGAGASVPLLGFGHLLAQGVVKAVDEIGLPGVFTGGIGAAAGGITASLVFALLAALVGGRLVWGLVSIPIYGLLTEQAFTLAAFWMGGFVNAWPGIVLQIVLIPAIVLALEKAKLFQQQ